MSAEVLATAEDAATALQAAAAITGGPALSPKMLELRETIEGLVTDDDVVVIEIQETPDEDGHQVVLLSITRLPSDPTRAAQAVIPMIPQQIEDMDVPVYAQVIWEATSAAFEAYATKQQVQEGSAS